MLLYEFQPNANHRFNVLFVTKLKDGRGGIAGIFNVNVRISDLGFCESVRIYERNRSMDLIAAAIYDAFSDYWCYPKGAKGEIFDGSKPMKGFVRVVNALVDKIGDGNMFINGTLEQSLAVFSEAAASEVSGMAQGSAKILVYADPSRG